MTAPKGFDALTPQERADETALDLWIENQRQSENDWRRRLAFELCKAYAQGRRDGAGDCPTCHNCRRPFKEPGVHAYYIDKNGGEHTCIHKSSPLEGKDEGVKIEKPTWMVLSSTLCDHCFCQLEPDLYNQAKLRIERLEKAETVCRSLEKMTVDGSHKPTGWDEAKKAFEEWRKVGGQ